MSTRPRTPGPSTPAPGKLALPELGEMKRRGDRIAMVTAYDAPAGAARRRGRRRARARRRLGGDGDARPRVDRPGDARRDDLPHARGHPRGAPAARDRRPAVRHVRDLRRAGGRRARSGWSRRAAPTCVKLEGAGPDGLARARDRRVEHRRDGPHRPDAAVGDEARRLPRAGPHRRGRAAALRRRARAAGRGLLRARARGRARRRSPRGSPRRSRSRRSGSAPAPAATARCSSGTTCSACTTGQAPRFVKRYAELADEIGERARGLRRRRPRRRVPRGAAHLLDPRRRARAASRPRSRERAARAARTPPSGDRRRRGTRGARPGPAVHRADADHEQHGRPERKREPRARRTTVAAGAARRRRRGGRARSP